MGMVFLPLFLLLIGASFSIALERELSEESVVFPRGVASPKDATAYVSTSSGIEAINLGEGKVRWAIDIIARPLIVSNGKLITQESTKALDTNYVIVILKCVGREG